MNNEIKNKILKSKVSVSNVRFNVIKLGLVSPKTIEHRSYGIVKKSETINYRTFKPERGGLFCAKIFGPLKDHECLCGKYRKLKYRGVVCEKCGVEVTLSKVRRSRLAHINLAAPIVHIWFLRSLPSKISLLLDMSLKNIEKILSFELYVVLNCGDSPLQIGDILTPSEYSECLLIFKKGFYCGIGISALEWLLSNVSLKNSVMNIIKDMKTSKSEIKLKKLRTRLKIVDSFINSDNDPSWMLLYKLPVLPPDLRPLVPLDSGKFATSDLNVLYRRVINRNNRLKKLIELNAPTLIIRNEKRMLQDSVDSLLDNSRRSRPLLGGNKRPLKSLSDMLRGKYGRFRQNLLGKRVDYSGRSVIIVGPNLKLNQCGLPKQMALELFKPFVYGKLLESGIAETLKIAKELVESEDLKVFSILSDVVDYHPVLLNRAPTLHRLGIQAFDIVLVDDKAIHLHPLVCSAFNADFDGDQMAVHVPLSIEAQLESRLLMLSSYNILSPANGNPVIAPSQDIVLGLYYLTIRLNSDIDYSFSFFSVDDLKLCYDMGFLHVHSNVRIKIGGFFYETTVGRVLFFSICPKNFLFNEVNLVVRKSTLLIFIKKCHRLFGVYETVLFSDRLMSLGFKYATLSGISIGLDDLVVPTNKYNLVSKGYEKVHFIENQYDNGFVTSRELHSKLIDIWTDVNDQITDSLMGELSFIRGSYINSLFIMYDSGARGSSSQIRQLSGMRGLMTKPDGSVIDTPIISNFREGLSSLEYFISSSGARKGLADTALKTANSGYLTRRLVDVSQDVVVCEVDCGTNFGLELSSINLHGYSVDSLYERVFGKVLCSDIYSSVTGNVILKRGVLLDENLVCFLDYIGVSIIKIRSPVFCESRFGICSYCYGTDLSTGYLVNIGVAVGVIAGQSIGEPGTQLTMRTFHVGGALSSYDTNVINNTIVVKNDGFIYLEGVKLLKSLSGCNIVVSKSGYVVNVNLFGRECEKHMLPYGSILHVSNSSKVLKGDLISSWEYGKHPIISESEGVVEYKNFTLLESSEDVIGLSSNIIMCGEATEECIPKLVVKSKNSFRSYSLNLNTYITVSNGSFINVGDFIGYVVVREVVTANRYNDITGGLPRVVDLFEARRGKNVKILSECSGIVFLEKKDTNDLKIKIILKSDDTVECFSYIVSSDRNILVFSGQRVRKGSVLVDGTVNLQDTLRLLGKDELSFLLCREIQEVYSFQGVSIDEKHVHVILRQMLRCVEIVDPGDFSFFKGETMTLNEVEFLNSESTGCKKIEYDYILLGITRSSLSTDSFISAASFQETTKVLIDGAIFGRKDYLSGLKENVIVGRLIPAGTGIYDDIHKGKFRNI